MAQSMQDLEHARKLLSPIQPMALSLKHARKLLYPIRNKWYDIGIELDLNIAELDVIKSQHNDDPAECLLEMIKIWLRSINPCPTWDVLAEALRAEAINELMVAEQVCSQQN